MRLETDRMFRKEPCWDYKIQAFRIGDFALMAWNGTVFVEGQLRLKIESPAARTFVANMSNGYAGYVLTRRALERGGYETSTPSNSKLAPEALDMIVDSSVDRWVGCSHEGLVWESLAYPKDQARIQDSPAGW